jgi:hypothetical protein
MPRAATTHDDSLPTAQRQGALREIPFMGVIYVVHEASKLGFVNGHPDWCNLGQGQPEVGPMAGAPRRIDSVAMRPEDHAYGPLGGTPELRACVAEYVNRLYRKGKRSRYGPENVCVAQGGRLALTRAMAAFGSVNVGYQLPDYTAYEDMFALHLARLHPVPIRGKSEDGFLVPSARLLEAIDEFGLAALVLSNPCNPTGNVLQGAELGALVRGARERGTTLLMDEFYSHFVYTSDGRPAAEGVSSAAFVEDVERERVLICDGLTKSHRYPGWRVGWILGPSAKMETLARAASSIDGGPSRIAQRAALAALEPKQSDQETRALREVFVKKRNLMLERLSALGLKFPGHSEGTFYLWGSLEDLPAPLDDSMGFFRAALERKVMTVPGPFFDVNPGKRRGGTSPYAKWMRFSFGPPMDNLKLGLDRLEQLVQSARRKGSRKRDSRAGKPRARASR